MARKAKIKMKRGKVKFKFKSDDDVLLHRHDGIQALLGAAMTSAMKLPAVTPSVTSDPQRPPSLPAGVGVEDSR